MAPDNDVQGHQSMLKHNKPFDENIDRKNQKRNISQKKILQPDVKRRYHKEDSKAPISQR
jgi:hypothetical protein